MMRPVAPTCASSVSGTADFAYVGHLPQGEPKAP